MSTPSSPARPTPVVWSFVIWIVGAIIGLITGILLFVATAIGGVFLAAAGGVAAGIGAGLIIMFGVVYLVLAILELIFVVKMWQGRNWARIVLTILAALQVIGTLTQGGNNSVWSWIQFVLVIIAAVLMYLPSSNAYFAKTPRAGEGAPAA